MRLIFNKIILHNFFSFEDAELNLNDMGYTLVEGRNYCKLDNAYSNGSGKSSIFNGICFALTGETAQGISDGVENIFTDPNDCWVELSFTADNDNFVLRRYKTPKNDLKIWVNGEDLSGKGVRESSRLLSDYLPDLTSTLLNSIIILGQGLPSRFTDNKPSHRKEIIEKLTKSDFMIQSIKDKLEFRQNELKTNLRNKEDLKLASESKLSVYESQLENYNKALEEYRDLGSSENNLDLAITDVSNRLLTVSDKVDQTANEIENKNKDRDSLSKKLSELILNNQLDLEKLLSDLDNTITSTQSNYNNLETEIKYTTKEIKKLESITDICPTCGQKIPGANKPDTTGLRSKLDSLNSEFTDVKLELDKLKTERKNKVDNFNLERSSSIKSLQDEINNLKEGISVLNRDRDSLSTQKITLSNELTKLMNLKENYSKLIKNIEEVSKSIENNNKLINETKSNIIEINAHLEVIQQMITLAKREFRGILLINIIECINKKVKQYSREVFDTEELSFTLNENSIDITYLGKPYENLSGGEKQKIDVIVQLALRDVLSKQLNIHSNLLVCDEIFDSLDLQGCSKIMNLISNLTDIDSVFIISHHTQDLELTKDNEIVVEKNDIGISSIKFV